MNTTETGNVNTPLTYAERKAHCLHIAGLLRGRSARVIRLFVDHSEEYASYTLVHERMKFRGVIGGVDQAIQKVNSDVGKACTEAELPFRLRVHRDPPKQRNVRCFNTDKRYYLVRQPT